MSVSLNIDTSDWDRKIELVRISINDFFPRFITDATEIIQEEMANQVPVKTGLLRASINSEISGDYSETGTHTGYGLFVDQPTRPHTIRGNPYLRFQIGGQQIITREVQHPGTAGSFFIRRTLDIIIPKINDVARQVWSTLVGSK